MSTRFFTNEGENTLYSKFKGIFEHNSDIGQFDALVGYFQASGYFRIQPFLRNVPGIRILIGISIDEIIARYHSKGLLFQADAGMALSLFLNDVKKDIQNAAYSQQIEEGILQFIEDVVSKKVEVRVHPSRKLHAKIYIFRPDGWNMHRTGSVITGSSNLTDPGLGTIKDSNYEFNVILHDYTDVAFATSEFEKLWQESVTVLPGDVEALKKETYLNSDYTPFELYMKFLIEYFGKSIDYDSGSISDLPEGFRNLSYQEDAVNDGLKLLQRHGGFFLSDVVGLGKTIVGARIAKKFFYTNGFPNHLSNTLVVVPPALKDNWTETLEKFRLTGYEVITNGSLHKITDPEKYDLIIVDEAHKFRNDTAEAYNELQKLCKTRTRLTDKDGRKMNKKVILISATPLNNRPQDIANQVYLFQDAKDSTLNVFNLQHFFRKRIDEYTRLSGIRDIKIVQNEVKKIYAEIRNKVIAPLTVRRTRTDLKAHPQYDNDLKKQGIHFPKIADPCKILYQLSPNLEQLYDETMLLLSNPDLGLKYYRYQAIRFLREKKKSKYKNADTASRALAGVMKTLLVKRIDSSFCAFKASLNRFTEATGAMIRMFEKGVIIIAPKLNVTEYIIEGREEELLQRVLEVKEEDLSVEICTPADFEEGFLPMLRNDYELLQSLNARWQNVTEDPKLDEFLLRLNTELMGAINHDKKLVVFSESRETTQYLVAELKSRGRTDVLEVHSGNRKNLQSTIRANFDANSKREEFENDYNIIICTEVLAEGINLHRSNVIVNYDTPWNATRLMQRIGRVNRIGSVAPMVYVFNFYPTARVNDDIELEKRAIMKLQAFHSALGEDSEIYSADEETQSFGLFSKNPEEERDQKLDFLMDVRKFKHENPELFRRILNMPLRSRVGRKERTKRDTTLCFMRNERRDTFYWIRADGSIEEMTFVEMAREFYANASEKPVPLPDTHHKHIQIAQRDFLDKLDEELSGQQVVDVTQGPNEIRALAYLEGFLSFPFIGEPEKNKIKAAKQAIRLGKFQQLQRDVNALQRESKRNKREAIALTEAILQIISRYPIDENLGDVQPVVTIKSFEKLQPEIILSESFSFNQ